ncbi:MAG: enoyl-CoA hydratase [Pseudomonadota bacterium]
MPAAKDLVAAALAIAFSTGLFAYAFIPASPTLIA